MTSPIDLSSAPADGLRSKLLSNSVWNLSAFLLVTVLGIVSVPLYIRFLGLDQYGLLVLLNSILAPMGLLNLGFGQATVKYVAECVGRHDSVGAAQYVRTTLLFNLVVGVLGAVVLALLAGYLTTRVFNIAPADQSLARSGFFLVAVGWLVTQVAATYQNVPTGLQQYKTVALGSSLFQAISISVGLLALLMGGGLLEMLTVRLIWNTVTIFLWAWVAHRQLPGVWLYPGWNGNAFRHSFRFGVWQSVASIGGVMASQTDKYLVGAYLSIAAVGVYGVAQTVQATVYAAIYKIGEVLFPAISALQGSGQIHRAVQLMLRSAFLLSLLTVASMGPLAVFAPDILRLYVGVEVAAAASWLLQVLAIAGMLSSGSVAVAQYLFGTAQTSWIAAFALASGTVILLAGLLLIPRFGLYGAGWAQIMAIVLTRPLIHGLLWRRKLQQEVPANTFFSYLYGPAGIGVGSTLLLIWTRTHLVWTPGWIGLLFGVSVCAGMLVAAILVVDYWLPNGKQRRRDTHQLFEMLMLRIRVWMRRWRVRTN